MSIKFGDSTPTNFYLGSTAVSALYQGANLVWPNPPNYVSYAPTGFNDTFTLGSGVFTLEWWQYRTALVVRSGDQPRVFSLGNYESTPAYSVTMENNTSYGYFESQTAFFFSDISFDINVWQHYAICRNSLNQMMYYKNGVVMQAFSGATQNIVNTPQQYLTIGADSTSSLSTGFPGYITNLHITRQCMYNPGGGFSNFTPPSSPITANANTRLLLLATTSASQYTDSGPLALTPGATTNTQWSSLSPYSGGVGGSIGFNV
jgi:hypothetical protein